MASTIGPETRAKRTSASPSYRTSIYPSPAWLPPGFISRLHPEDTTSPTATRTKKTAPYGEIYRGSFFSELCLLRHATLPGTGVNTARHASQRARTRLSVQVDGVDAAQRADDGEAQVSQASGETCREAPARATPLRRSPPLPVRSDAPPELRQHHHLRPAGRGGRRTGDGGWG